MKNVIIYTTLTCPWCKKTKEFFKEHNVKYKEIDVVNNSKAAAEIIKKSGQMGVPVIDIEGKIVVGFDEPQLRRLLKIK